MATVTESDLSTECFTRLVKQANSGMTYQQLCPVSYELVSQDGIPYEAFNAKAKVKPWSVFRLIECSRAFAWWVPLIDGEKETTFMDFKKLPYLLFTVSASLKFQKEIYDDDTNKKNLVIRNKLSFIGRTSFKYNTVIEFPTFKDPLVDMDTQFVFVDPLTHKAAAPPEWWNHKYKPLMESSSMPLKIPALDISSATLLNQDQIRVMPSDIDPYLHVNWAHYVKYCMDIFVLHQVSAGTENLYPKVKCVDVNYKGEASMGDVLVIKWWTDTTDSQRNNFLVYKEEIVICECKIEFFNEM